MGKGDISTDTLFHIGLFVIVLIGIAAIFLGPGVDIGRKALASIGEYFGLDTLEQETQRYLLKSALKCSYYRCEKGCDEIDDDDYFGIKCRSDFCNNAQWMDDDKKVCGFNAAQYPVEIELERDITVSKDDFGSQFDCILPEDGWNYNFGDFLYNIVIGGKVEAWNFFWDLVGVTEGWDCSLLIVENAIIDESEALKETCNVRGKNWGDSYKNFKIKGEKMFVHSADSEILGSTLSGSKYTYISSEAGFKTIHYDTPKILTFEKVKEGLNYRIVVKGDKGNSETYIRFDSIYRREGCLAMSPEECPPDTVDVSVGCSLIDEQQKTISPGDEETFCNANIRISFDEMSSETPFYGTSREYIIMSIEYTNPNCHGLDPLNCDWPCKGCYRDQFSQAIPDMCCYWSESCDEGICENYEDPKCYEKDPSDCSPLCKPCYREHTSVTQPVMCCYPGESCNNGICEDYEAPCGNGVLDDGEVCDTKKGKDTREYCDDCYAKCEGYLLYSCDECTDWVDNGCEPLCGADDKCGGYTKAYPGDLCYGETDVFCDDNCQCGLGIPNIKYIIGAEDWDNIPSIEGAKIFSAVVEVEGGSIGDEGIVCGWTIDGVENNFLTLYDEHLPFIFNSESWDATLGSHTIEFIVDRDDAVIESDETDNKFVKTFTVT